VTHSHLATPSATRAVLASHGLATKKRLGQHFLVDDNVVGRILALADLSGDEVVLEVGPGIGTLTVALCDAAGALVAVERDQQLESVLAETTAGCARFALIQADAVRVPIEELCAPFGPAVALVANLPYGVAATVLLRFFEQMPSLRTATVMVQSEVAERIAAHPGTKEYGSYTVKLRLYAEPVSKFAVARSCFLPPPRVDSAVVRLERRTKSWTRSEAYPEADGDSAQSLADAAAAADAAFAQRRKTIRNSLRAVLAAPTAAIDVALDAAKIDGGVRAEMLEPSAFVALGSALRGVGAL
jgi:16S rRNA (adenine1518-N6/adenine1519-N6)-dimethyltransferase